MWVLQGLILGWVCIDHRVLYIVVTGILPVIPACTIGYRSCFSILDCSVGCWGCFSVGVLKEGVRIATVHSMVNVSSLVFTLPVWEHRVSADDRIAKFRVRLTIKGHWILFSGKDIWEVAIKDIHGNSP